MRITKLGAIGVLLSCILFASCTWKAGPMTGLRANTGGEGGNESNSTRPSRRPAGTDVKGFGIVRYERLSGSGEIALIDSSSNNIGTFTVLPDPGTYRVMWQGIPLLIRQSSAATNLTLTDERSGNVDVWKREDMVWKLVNGVGELRNTFRQQVILGGKIIDDIGAANLSRLSAEQRTLASRKGLMSNIGCYSSGFCSAEFTSCTDDQSVCSASSGAEGGPGGGGGIPGSENNSNSGNGCANPVIGGGFGFSRTPSVFGAIADANALCKARTDGNGVSCGADACCQFARPDGTWGDNPQADCACLPDTDVFCYCRVFGRANC